MHFRLTSLYQTRLWVTDTASPSLYGSVMEYQPFMNRERMESSDKLLLDWAQAHGQWTQWLSKEQTTYALAQVTANRALPLLTQYVSIATLLDSRIHLRDYLEPNMVEALSSTLYHHSQNLEWRQLDATCFVYVIGAGIAACIDARQQDEVLYLRYSNQIADAIARAKSESDLPRSLKALENNLQECFDLLLTSTRTLTLQHLAG